MTRRALLACLAPLLALVAGALPGCAPPAPSAPALLDYLWNVRHQAGVRRAWPAGQAYLDRITRAYVALQRERSALEQEAAPEALWPLDHPSWQDPAALGARIAELQALVDEAGPHAKARGKALDALAEALPRLPPDLPLADDAARTDFVAQAWNALAGGPDALSAELAQLVRDVQTTLEVYPAGRAALAGDAQKKQEFADLYAARQQALTEQREQSLAVAEQRLLDLPPRIAALNKRTQRLEYERLSNERQFLHNVLELLPRKLNARADEAKKERKRVAGQPTAADAAAHRTELLAFYERREQALRAEAAGIRARVDEIFRQADAKR